jgi:hypothetical protein
VVLVVALVVVAWRTRARNGQGHVG